MDHTSRRLFDYATSEMSHSAYWAWVLAHSPAAGADVHCEVEALREKLLTHLLDGKFKDEFRGEVSVAREHKLEKGRADIVVWNARCCNEASHVLVIETKLGDASHAAEQVAGYVNTLKSKNDANDVTYHAATLVYDYPFNKKDLQQKLPSSACAESLLGSVPEPTCKHGVNVIQMPIGGILGMYELMRMDPNRRLDSHPILHQHYCWVKERYDRWVNFEAQIDSSDWNAFLCHHGDAVKQWCMMRRLADGICGWQYRDANRNGSRWTQFRFHEREGRHDTPSKREIPGEAIFLRIDQDSKDRCYLAIRHYSRPKVEPGEDYKEVLRGFGKNDRVQELRDAWQKSISKSELPGRQDRSIGGEKYESTIAYYFLKDAGSMELDEFIAQLQQRVASFLEQAEVKEIWPK